ncbi:hypothetical protein LEP1GSC016_0987 [Leptospira borgpetersenii serovar Hardjo-bovis str. Sponselee]|uniref:Uncharacterized protein n=1 Tax=Leptospira borgpetersenii serovar Hardjo-bovis str. Sponselee TaxID=1303729 RepID=M6BHF2_LEPBO|nr:hypothetical protein LEP1GSC016_0987 [Leptospira borgpetersenii serovar Hardjo-bovis str. Sponselee]
MPILFDEMHFPDQGLIEARKSGTRPIFVSYYLSYRSIG